MIMEDCVPERLSSAVAPLMLDETARRTQRDGFAEALEKLGRGGASPSVRAADEVLAVIARRRQA
jgi:lipid-A-disaccharide synthase